MPAVTYRTAARTMGIWGDDVLTYIDEQLDDVGLPLGLSWGGIAVHFLSRAVEYWAYGVEQEVENALAEQEEDDAE